MRISDWSSDVCSFRSVPRLHHRLGGGADQAERGFQIDADHLIPLLVLHPHRQIVARYPSVVDEDVEPATQRLDRARNQPVDIGRIGQVAWQDHGIAADRSEEHTSELQSLMRISYAVFCLKKKQKNVNDTQTNHIQHTL